MIIKQILGILNKSQKKNLILLLILMFIGAVIELMGVSFIMPLVDLISNPDAINNENYRIVGEIFSLHTLNQYSVFFAAALIVVYVFKNAYLIVEYDIQYRYVYNGQRDLMKRMLRCYTNEDYIYHVNHNPAELQRNILTDVENAFQSLLAMLQLTTELLVCAILVLYLMVTDISTTLAVFFILAIFTSVFFVFYKKYSHIIGIRARTQSAEQLKWVNQTLAGIKEIKVSDTEHFFIGKFDDVAQKYSYIRRINSLMGIISRPIMETILICGLLIMILIRIYMGAEMTNIIPTLSVFVVAAFRMLPSINRITNAFNNIMYGKPFIEAMYNELQKQEYYEESQTKDDCINKESVGSNNEDIELANISYRYPMSDDYVLDNINMCIRGNKSTAIIGESGAGKSTLADVLLGILKPDRGTIMYHNVNIYDSLKWWHKNIGYIPQVIYLMDSTIMQNVAFGIDEKDIDEDKIWESLKEAQLAEFVKSLPEQLNTKVGDRGVKLSGGQRQRIGIARALYNNPKILIMDEATSALDNDTESAVMEAIEKMQGTRTIIIIAHRLTTIKNCDYIYKVADKNIEEISKSVIK